MGVSSIPAPPRRYRGTSWGYTDWLQKFRTNIYSADRIRLTPSFYAMKQSLFGALSCHIGSTPWVVWASQHPLEGMWLPSVGILISGTVKNQYCDLESAQDLSKTFILCHETIYVWGPFLPYEEYRMGSLSISVPPRRHEIHPVGILTGWDRLEPILWLRKMTGSV